MIQLEDFPTVNAVLNGTSASLLVLGFVLIRRGRERAHRNAMLAAFGCSVVFLASYLYYHAQAGSTRYPGEGLDRSLYLVLLGTHTVLAAAVPILSARTIYLGLKDRRASHRRWARVTFPVWLYVSVTGVLIYLILYHWAAPAAPAVVAPG